MNIIISGAGKVGFNLAKTLSLGHNVTIIDKNVDALLKIQESLDVLILHGSSENRAVYEKVENKNINLFIAVTDDDNSKLVSLMVADTVLNIKKRMIRIKNQFLNNQEIIDKFGIDKLIFPIDIASKTISTLLAYPETNNVKFLTHTKYKLISILVPAYFEPKLFYSSKFPIIGIERSKEFFVISHNSIEILPYDLVYFIGRKEDIQEVYRAMELKSSKEIQKCVVFGAEPLGIAIAKELARSGRSVKIVEKSLELCQKADDALGGTVSIINTKYSVQDISCAEGLEYADMFVATSKNDEFNIVKTLEAKESGIKKVIAINNDIEHYGLMHLLGIIAIRGPKISAYNSIIEEINSTNIVLQKFFCGSKGVIFIRKIFPNSPLIGKEIKAPKRENIILFYIKNEILSPFEQSIKIEVDDSLVAFTTVKESQKIKDWMYGL